MKRKRLTALLFSALTALALLPVPGLPAARALEVEGDLSAPHAGYIVKLTPEAAVSLLFDGEEAADPASFVVLDTLEEALEVPEELVEYIEPNYLVELLELPEGGSESGEAPSDGFNDPLYREYQWNFQEIHVYDAWRRGLTGQGVKVGFVDSGIRRDHEDLNAEHISGRDFLSDDPSDMQDTVGHGTFTAGLTAAQSNNGLGLAGVAPDVQIMAYRVFSAKTASISKIVAGIDQAAADRCQILNLSLGLDTFSNTLQQAVDRALDAGIIVIASVGNSYSSTLLYPAACPGVIGVGSVDRDLTRSPFSHYNESVDFVTFANGIPGLSNEAGNGYKTGSSNRGTSYASPVIAGLAALALSYDPDITPEQLFTLLRLSSEDLGEPGYDTSFGYGLPDAGRMAELLTTPQTVRLHAGEGGVLPDGITGTYLRKAYTDPQLPLPARPGYRFAGWYEDAACRGPRLTALPPDTTAGSSVDLYAGWIPEDRSPQAWWADYGDDGRMRSLEQLPVEAWAGPVLPGEAEGTRRIFWMDGDFRPAALGAASPAD